MPRKRVAGKAPRGRGLRGRKAKDEEKEAGESEAQLGLGGDAGEDPEAGLGVGSGEAGSLEVGAEETALPEARGCPATWVVLDVAPPLSSREE